MTTLMCLAAAIFFEAGVEDLHGKYLVGSVIMNRVEDSRYPNDVCSVVFEDQQFSFTHDGKSDKVPASEVESVEVAKDILRGNIVSTTATHYHASYVSPSWRKSFTFNERHGTHLFYTNETPWR